jgi:hypothetical protein
VVGGGRIRRRHNELMRCRRRVATCGAHLSTRHGEGQRRLEAGRFPVMEAEIGQGADVARGPIGPGEEGDSPGRSGLAWWPGLAGLISIGKNQKGF